MAMTIELLDGTILTCRLKDTPGEPISGNLSIDTTGEYLSVGGNPTPSKRRPQTELVRQFLDHIMLFCSNIERILSDSRLFLTPVPVQNGLAFTGTSGFLSPTLGVYAEWWHHNHNESHDKENNPIWFITGSPLSGSHACSSITPDGSTISCCKLQGAFSNTWRSFMEINNRYNDAKAQCEACSLDEAIRILSE